MKDKIIVATRKSPLALVQTKLVIEYLKERLSSYTFEVLPLVTTGDKKTHWSLEKKGGKGLFTQELEVALMEGRAQLAVHSAKDLPTTGMTQGLTIAGFLPREDPCDVFIRRKESMTPRFIATSSPRRRVQAKKLHPQAVWCEIRGNVDTRLKKIVSGRAEATILAAAGLKRLGIQDWPGLIFEPFGFHQMVPAVGQGAIALQCRNEAVPIFAPLLDTLTGNAVNIERCFLRKLGGGCHSISTAYYDSGELMVFHEELGFQKFSFTVEKESEISEAMDTILQKLNTQKLKTQ